MAESKIQHLIVLMLENRAFDHMLGYLQYPQGTAFEGIAGKEKDFGNPYGDGKVAYPQPKANYWISPGPNHSHTSVMRQLIQSPQASYPYHITNLGFVEDYATIAPEHPDDVLNCFKPEHLPVLSKLAQSFAVCDHWFCSVPGETWPNRNYAHAANSDGEVAIVFRSYANKTIYEQLSENQRDWVIYYSGFPPQSIVFTNLWRDERHKWIQRFQPINEIYRAIQTDHLPEYAFVEPDMLGVNSDSQHPGMGGLDDFQLGERLVWRLYHHLRENPAVFQKTLLMITYDEHGGFFDHIPPPQGKDLEVDPAYCNEDGEVIFPFDLLGPRVPAVFVSPWIPAGMVDQTLYEHASIPATVRKLFQVSAAPLSSRDAQAKTFEGITTLDQPRTDDFPEIEEPQINEEQRKPKVGVPLRESMAWILGNMLWDNLSDQAKKQPNLFDHLGKALGVPQGSKESSGTPAVINALKTISPQLSEDAKNILGDAQSELAHLEDTISNFSSSLSVPEGLKLIKKQLRRMLMDEALSDDAQKIGEWLFRLFEEPILILHTADGRTILEPGEDGFQQALENLRSQPQSGKRIWLANHNCRWMDFTANGQAVFYDHDPAQTLRTEQVDEQQAKQLFSDFQNDQLDEIRQFFKAQEGTKNQAAQNTN